MDDELNINYPIKAAQDRSEEIGEGYLFFEKERILYWKPYLDLEARYYVNFGRRESLNKSIANRSGNYVNVKNAVYFDGLNVFMVNYGLQRNRKIFWLDWNFGLGYSSSKRGNSPVVGGLLKLGFRIR